MGSRFRGLGENGVGWHPPPLPKQKGRPEEMPSSLRPIPSHREAEGWGLVGLSPLPLPPGEEGSAQERRWPQGPCSRLVALEGDEAVLGPTRTAPVGEGDGGPVKYPKGEVEPVSRGHDCTSG